MPPFSSEAKMRVRQDDLRLIAELSRKANRTLTYLGLPSPWMVDVIAWKPYLSQVFAIEQEKRYLSHLMDTAYSLGLINQAVYFWGDIDTIIKVQHDEFGRSIDKIFPVDLINLDYCEGLDYRGFSKLSTLEQLIIRQKEALIPGRLGISFPYFLILLTHNLPLHEGDPTAKKQYMKFLTREAKHYEDSLKRQIEDALGWYLSAECPTAYQHKCFVLGKVFEYAQAQGFKAVPKKVTQYLGDKGATMLHYQFQIMPVKLGSPVPVDNKMDVIDIMNYPVNDDQGSEIALNRPIIRE